MSDVTADDLKGLDIQALVHHAFPEIPWRTPKTPDCAACGREISGENAMANGPGQVKCGFCNQQRARAQWARRRRGGKESPEMLKPSRGQDTKGMSSRAG